MRANPDLADLAYSRTKSKRHDPPPKPLHTWIPAPKIVFAPTVREGHPSSPTSIEPTLHCLIPGSPQTKEKYVLPHSIAIVGAGTAGLASALALARQGHSVTVFEKVPTPGPVGAGILLQPTGQAVLQDWDLLRAVSNLGAPVTSLQGFSANGRQVMGLQYGAGAGGVGVHRGALFGVLWQAAVDAGVCFRSGVAIDHIKHLPGGLGLHADGNTLGVFDLMIWAAGSFAPLPLGVPLIRKVRPYPWGALWAVFPDTGLPWPGVLRQWYRSAYEMLGVMPSGWRAPSEQQSPPWASLFWSLPICEFEAWRQHAEIHGMQSWKNRILALEPQMEPWLHSLRAPTDLALARYADVRMPRTVAERIVVIGDSAHAMSPQLGQGANLALIDAWVLADALRTASDLQAGLESYQRRRRGHIAYYQAASRLLTPVFQSHQRLVPCLRDRLFHMMSRMPLSRHMIHQTLTGYQCGWMGQRWRDGPAG